MAKRKDGKIFPEIIYMFICEEENEDNNKESVLSIRYKQRGKRFFTCLLTDGMDDSVIKAIQERAEWSQKNGTIKWENTSISILELWKKAFLYSEKIVQEPADKRIKKCLQNTLKASVQRNHVYRKDVKDSDKEKFRTYWKNELCKVAKKYPYGNSLDEDDIRSKHCDNIHALKEYLSQEPYKVLKKDGLNIGTAQKSLNLYLKYLWCLEAIETSPCCWEPPHCTVDRIVLEEVRKSNGIGEWKGDNFPKWTECDDRERYEGWIDQMEIARKKEPEIKSLAEWELYVWSSK